MFYATASNGCSLEDQEQDSDAYMYSFSLSHSLYCHVIASASHASGIFIKLAMKSI
jgi:hypothetical protein